MKTAAILPIIMMLTACASAPSASTPGAPQAASSTGAAVTSAKPKQVCVSDDSTGSRLKRPVCRKVVEGNEKALRDDILRDNTDELRQLDEHR